MSLTERKAVGVGSPVKIKRHKVLERHIQEILLEKLNRPELVQELSTFLDAINQSMNQLESERHSLERAMEANSKELINMNREVRIQNNELQSIYRIMNHIHSRQSIEVIFSKVASEIAAATGLPVAWVELFDVKSGVCKIQSLAGAPQTASRFVGTDLKISDVPHMKALSVGAEVYSVRDLEGSDESCQLYSEMNIMSMAAISMKINGVWAGSIAVGDVQPNFKLDSVIKYLQTVAGQIATGYERNKLNELNRKQEAVVLSSSKMSELGKMAGGIAHEINTPLNVIMLLVDDLAERAVEEKVDSFLPALDNIMTTVLRIATIVKGLKSFSRDGAGDPFLPVNLGTIIKETYAFSKARCDHLQVKFTATCPDGIELKCRQSQISQALLILFSNSVDAISELTERWINVDVERVDNGVQIAVTDSGGGIPPEIQDKLAMPFFTTKEVGSGTGLGLSIAMNIVKDHSGQFSLDKNCKNTRFIIYLPLDPNVVVTQSNVA